MRSYMPTHHYTPFSESQPCKRYVIYSRFVTACFNASNILGYDSALIDGSSIDYSSATGIDITVISSISYLISMLTNAHCNVLSRM